ncbi:MAG: MvdC/MvdD family ATP grasp protein [Candidatus Eisenbacteria bacterium]
MSTRPGLLIVTNRADFAADFLITRLLELDLPYFRLDADVLVSARLSSWIGQGSEETRICLEGKRVELSTIGCVWYRRQLRPSTLDGVSRPFRTFAAAELQHLYEGLLHARTRWVNPLLATEAAERKLFQLRLAPSCGLLVPPTLVSSDQDELLAFARQGPVVCKPASQGFLSTGSEQFAVYTREVTVDEIRQQEDCGHFPTLLQRRVEKGVDVRVTIIGRKVFPVEVRTPSDAPVDWRAVPEGVSYAQCTIPASVERGCRELMSRLHLEYGAFDFIRTPNQEWYFLEVNPAGEWAWLEVALALPMREAFVHLFFGEGK